MWNIEKKVKQIHLSIFLALFLLVFELKNEKSQEKILERSIFVVYKRLVYMKKHLFLMENMIE